MRKALACAVLTCMVAAPAFASDWTDVPWSPNSRAGVSNVQVDLDSLKVTLANQYHGVMKTFWMRRMHTDGAKDMGHVTVDCAARTYVVDSSIKYDKNGAMLDSLTGDFRSAPIPPDTDFDAVRKMVCY